MKFKIISTILICLLLGCALAGCAASTNTEGAVVEEAIKTAYYQKYQQDGCLMEDLSVRYYGEYDGCHVAFIDGGPYDYRTVLTEDVIAGYTFTYNNSHKLDVYRDGEILTLAEAYEAGWLTEEAVAQLHADYNE